MTARILVVDDLAPNTRLLEAKLTHEYFDVLTASDGKSALKIVRDESPDIVLLDVMMPGMDGFEVCRRMKQDPASAHIPVIMVTALSDVADRVRGLEAGADDFLTKPINDVALLARVKSLVRLKMMLDELRLRENTSEQLGAIDDPVDAGGDVSEGARVVLVEDNDLSAERFELIAGEAGYRIDRFRDGAAALEATKDSDVELTIVSLNLEKEDALRLCSQMRSAETTRHLPVLLVIEDSDTNRLAKGLEIGANDYIVRPFDRQELLARMRTQVRRHRYEQRLRENYRLSISMALTDALTGLYNRRYFDTHFETQIRHAGETGKPLALLMLDLDRFKAINDTHGHNVGDQVLRETARRLAGNLRTVDMVARFGGEEFAIVMPDTTPDIAFSAAERLRARIGETPFTVASDTAAEITVTTSIGVAVASRHPDTTDLLKRADYALYAAKRAGRNTVHLFPEDADFTSATGTAA
ncbi:MAG TPA: PleD family two-component system response regulator [Alphaproteobacteria bacterium]|nr:PleD family two-component system response regulator [Alphaproteobacteria bacterium]